MSSMFVRDDVRAVPEKPDEKKKREKEARRWDDLLWMLEHESKKTSVAWHMRFKR